MPTPVASNPFRSRVGLAYTGAPATPILIDSLPGMSVELVDNLRYTDAAELLARLEPVALEKLTEKLETALLGHGSFKHIVARLLPQLPRPQVPGTLNAPSANATLTARAGDTLTKLHLESLTFTPYYTGQETFLLRITNPLTGESIFSQADIVAPSGVPYTKTLGVSIAPGLSEYSVLIELLAESGHSVSFQQYRSQNTAPDCGRYAGAGALVLSMDFGTETPDTLMPGFHVSARLVSDAAMLLERYAEQLQWAYAYQMAAVLLDEKLSSNLLNVYTASNLDDTALRQKQYEKEVLNRMPSVVAAIVRDMQISDSTFLDPAGAENSSGESYSYGSYV